MRCRMRASSRVGGYIGERPLHAAGEGGHALRSRARRSSGVSPASELSSRCPRVSRMRRISRTSRFASASRCCPAPSACCAVAHQPCGRRPPLRSACDRGSRRRRASGYSRRSAAKSAMENRSGPRRSTGSFDRRSPRAPSSLSPQVSRLAAAAQTARDRHARSPPGWRARSAPPRIHRPHVRRSRRLGARAQLVRTSRNAAACVRL